MYNPIFEYRKKDINQITKIESKYKSNFIWLIYQYFYLLSYRYLKLENYNYSINSNIRKLKHLIEIKL